MNPTDNAKPKAKFSSRNLSAVFKAPLRTKPLADNATGSLQRPNSRMLVLGRAAVAPPAPLNTPSLKRESQVHDVHVSLVPAGSNWAESAEKQQKTEAPELSPAPADVVVSTVAPEKVWTPENVAEHLHTGSVSARPKMMVESSGRWGDDAVEQDIVQNNIRRQMQKEREFPDLKEAVEEVQTHHDQGHTPVADTLPSQQSEQHQGRATGRWAHFNEQQEMHRPVHDRYERDEGDAMAEVKTIAGRMAVTPGMTVTMASDDTISPVPNDSHTHFSRSDARFDVLASGDRDRVLSHSPHRMDWSRGRLARRDGRSSSPSSLNGPKDSSFGFRSPRPDRSLTHSPAPKTLPMTADVAPARAMNWRNLSSSEEESIRAWGRAATACSKDEEPSTPVAEAVESSSTGSSSNASAKSSPSPQIQLLKRPKMLFDPKTGSMVNAEDKAASGKRQAGTKTTKSSKPPAAAVTSSVIAVHSVQDVAVKDTARGSKTASSVSSNVVEPTADKVYPKENNKRRSAKGAIPKGGGVFNRRVGIVRRNVEVRGILQRMYLIVRGPAMERPPNVSTSLQQKSGGDGRDAVKGNPHDVELLKQIAEGSSGGVVVLTDEKKGIEVSQEGEGFETVKSRRAVLNEKKQLRQRLASTEAAAPASDERKSLVEEQQSKGSRFKRTSAMLESGAGVQGQEARTKQPKQAKSKHVLAKSAAPASAAAKQPASPMKPTEQVAGEAPTESTVSKKRTQYVKVVPATEENSRREKQTQGSSTRKSSDRKASSSSAGGNHQKHEPTKHTAQKVSTRGPVAKAKSKQVRQVYVVKTPAPQQPRPAARRPPPHR
ncbi:BAT2, N-terminal [Phytophthora cactorum]|nr:BAT2, N-terminal [Phytophthora cactorum]